MEPPSRNRAQLRIRQFLPVFGDDPGAALVVILSIALRRRIDVVHDGDVPVHVHPCNGETLETDAVEGVRRLGLSGARFSMLVITDTEVEFFRASELRQAKVAAVSFFSNPFSASDLDAVARLVHEHDYAREVERERALLAFLDGSESLTLRTERSAATFRHRAARHWFSLAGTLDFGQQTVLPTGELSALRLASGEFDESSRLELDGTLFLSGVAIVHRGSASTSLESALELQRALTSELATGVLATLERGVIVEVRGADGGPHGNGSALRRLLDEDARYAFVHEVGFGLNPGCARLRRDNWFANERCPGVHLGLGLGSHTRVHVDLVCPGLTVLSTDSEGRIFRFNEGVPTSGPGFLTE